VVLTLKTVFAILAREKEQESNVMIVIFAILATCVSLFVISMKIKERKKNDVLYSSWVTTSHWYFSNFLYGFCSMYFNLE